MTTIVNTKASGRLTELVTLINISLPLTAAYVAEMAMVITDMIIVGRLGSNELAAVGLAGDWFWVVLVIGMGVISIVGVIAAQNLGEGNREAVIETNSQGMIAATLMTVPVTLSVWFMGPLLSFTGQDPDIIRLVTDYSRVIAFAVLPALWYVVLRNYITALARSGAIFWITLVALALNVALNYTLVYGKFGFPAMGVVGAGLGTTIVNWLMFVALTVHVMTSKHLADYRPQIIPRHVNRELLKEIFVLGIPISLAQFVSAALFTVTAVLVGTIGAAALAAQQIVYSVIYMSLSAAAALGEAVKVRVAYWIGRRSVIQSAQSAHLSFIVAGMATLAASIVMWLFPEALTQIFLDTDDANNQAVIEIAVLLSAYAGGFLLLDGLLMVSSNAIRGLKDTRSPLVISIVAYWVIGLGSGLPLCFYWDWGITGLWTGMISGVIAGNLLMFVQFNRRVDEAHKVVTAGAPGD